MDRSPKADIAVVCQLLWRDGTGEDQPIRTEAIFQGEGQHIVQVFSFLQITVDRQARGTKHREDLFEAGYLLVHGGGRFPVVGDP